MLTQTSRNLLRQLMIERAELAQANRALAIDCISQPVERKHAEEQLLKSRLKRLPLPAVEEN